MMRKIKMLLWCIVLCLGIGTAAAMADSGVTILSSPKRVDLYRAFENVFYSGSIRYKLENGAKVVKHSITQYQEAAGFEMELFAEGNNVYRMDLRGGFDHLELENYGLPDELPFTFTIETDKGTESVTFPVCMHADPWDTRRVEMDRYEGNEVKVGDTFKIAKPTLDGKIVRTGLTNNANVEHAHHHPDPYFGNGWVNDFAWSADTLKLKGEIGDAFIMEAIWCRGQLPV